MKPIAIQLSRNSVPILLLRLNSISKAHWCIFSNEIISCSSAAF